MKSKIGIGKFPVSREELFDLYVNKQMTCGEIGKLLNLNKGKVLNWVKKFGIPVRPTGNIRGKKYHFESHNKLTFDDTLLTEMYLNGTPMRIMKDIFQCDSGPIRRRAKELGLKRSPETYHSMLSTYKPDKSKDELMISLYNQGMSGPEISNIVGFSSVTVLNHIRNSGVRKTRTLSESQFTHNKKDFPADLDDPEKLYDLYVSNKLSKKDIGLMYNVAPTVVDSRLRKFGINVRGISEVMKGRFVGDNHPNWKGGRSGLYMRLREYFWVNQIQDILKRDHYKCQICGSKKKLQVHHIIPFKQLFEDILNEHPKLDIIKDEHELYNIMRNDPRLNDLDNLITYCKDCHLFKVHGYKKTKPQCSNSHHRTQQ